MVPCVPSAMSRLSRGSGSDFSQCWRNTLNSVRGESRTSGVPERSTFRMILDTPAADRTSPTTKAIIPRIKRASETPERPTPDLRAKKEKIARVGVNAEAENFFRGGIDEIEAIVRNRTGKEMTTTVKNPSIHSVGFETAAPAIAPSGKATASKNHDRISSSISLRKFRTLSP